MSWHAHRRERDDPAAIAKKVSSPTKSTNDAHLQDYRVLFFSTLVEQIILLIGIVVSLHSISKIEKNTRVGKLSLAILIHSLISARPHQRKEQ